MIALATRANFLSPIDKPAILASYEQGLFTEGHLRVLLDNYESLQEIAREGQRSKAEPRPQPVERMPLDLMTDEQHRECGCEVCLRILREKGL